MKRVGRAAVASLILIAVSTLISFSVLGFLFMTDAALAALITKPAPLQINIAVTSNETKQSIILALMTWQTQLPDLEWQLSSDSEHAIVFRDWAPNLDVTQTYGGTAGAVEYWIAYTSNRRVVTFNRWPLDRPVLTAMHEFGHVLGVPHSDDIRSVMYPELQDGPEQIMPADAAATHYRTGVTTVIAWTQYAGRPFDIFTRPKQIPLAYAVFTP